MSEFEYCSCPVCGSDTPEAYIETHDRFDLDNSDTYQISRCKACTMVYLNPRPRESDSDQYYQHEDYLPFASASAPVSLTERLYTQLRHYNLEWKKRLIERFKQGGNLLDIGCGTGEFLAKMKVAQWRVQGLERDAQASTWGRENLCLSVETGSIEDLEKNDSQFDVITLWHVLEHFYSPANAFRILSSKLKPDSILMIAVPNIQSLDARIYGSYWIALDTPRHVNHFSLKTLTQLGKQNGFKLLKSRQLPLDAFYNTIMSEKLLAERKHTTPMLWPLRLLRAGCVTAGSLIAGSRFSTSPALVAASIVAVFQKDSNA